MAHEMAGRHISSASKPLHVPTDVHADTPTYLELSPGGHNDLSPCKPKVKYHTADVPLPDDHPHADMPEHRGGSISGREGVGGQMHVVHKEKPSMTERVKAALPGTKEHKAKKEAEQYLHA